MAIVPCMRRYLCSFFWRKFISGALGMEEEVEDELTRMEHEDCERDGDDLTTRTTVYAISD